MTKKAFLAPCGVVLLFASAPTPVWGQASPGGVAAILAAEDDDPAARLAENLKALARDPYNVDALVAAGSGALAVGDANAAFGFFARAEELSPSNWRAKAGLGSSLTMMERSKDALRLFEEASALGAPDPAIVADRGLAYDLEGDGKKAQRDYQAALKSAPSDEVVRRYALSLGVNGDKDAALAKLDPLVRRNDQGAWRARAFILAMNGDLAGADRIVRMVAPAESATTMLGFMQRLGGLNASAKAHAVHFGTLPSSGDALALVDEEAGFSPLDTASGVRLDSAEPANRSTSSTASDARRLGRQERENARQAERGRRVATSTPLSTPPATSLASPPATNVAAVTVPARSTPAVSMAEPQADQAVPVTPDPMPAPVKTAASQVDAPAPLFEVPPAPLRSASTPASRPNVSEVRPVEVAPRVAMAPASEGAAATPSASPPAQATAVVTPVAPRFVLSDVVRTLELEEESQPVALPDEARMRALRLAAQKKAAAEEKARAEKAEAERRAAEEAAKIRRNPARVWVQIATGGNMAGLSGTWRSIRSKSPNVLGDMRAWYVPFKRTNRIVVGPVSSTSEARSIVNKLAKDGVDANIFSSEAGQEVERIGSK